MDKSTNNMKDILNLLLSTEPNDIPNFCALDLSKLPPVCGHINFIEGHAKCETFGGYT